MPFTPRPWIVDCNCVDSIDNMIHCVAQSEGTEHEWIAFGIEDRDLYAASLTYGHPDNASLIAAAPQLYEACTTVIGAWESGSPGAAARLCAAAVELAEKPCIRSPNELPAGNPIAPSNFAPIASSPDLEACIDHLLATFTDNNLRLIESRLTRYLRRCRCRRCRA